MKIHPKALQALWLILGSAAERQPMTTRKLMGLMGNRSPNSASRHIEALESLGLVRFERGKAATIRPNCSILLFVDNPTELLTKGG